MRCLVGRQAAAGGGVSAFAPRDIRTLADVRALEPHVVGLRALAFGGRNARCGCLFAPVCLRYRITFLFVLFYTMYCRACAAMAAGRVRGNAGCQLLSHHARRRRRGAFLCVCVVV